MAILRQRGSRPIRRPQERGTTTRHDTVQMWMMVEILPPGVQHGGDADLRAEVLWISGMVRSASPAAVLNKSP